MNTITLVPKTEEGRIKSPLWAIASWFRLIEQVRKYNPDVVILIARKMPRLVEHLKADFGQALVISDLGVAFSGSEIQHSRVAILDDVVNVGSTLTNAVTLVQAFNPSSIRIFSLAKRNGKIYDTLANDGDIQFSFAIEHPLSASDYQEHVRRVPQAICTLNKPYDLAFPIVPCRFALPLRSVSEVIQQLKIEFGEHAVHFLPSTYHNSPISRAVVFPKQTESPYHCKLRLYFDVRTSTCNVVPICVPPKFENDTFHFQLRIVKELHAELVDQIDKRLNGFELAESDARASAALFTYSLDWFLASGISQKLSTSLVTSESDVISNKDAQLLFGRSFPDKRLAAITGLDQPAVGEAQMPEVTSAFLNYFVNGNNGLFINKVCEHLSLSSPTISEDGLDAYAYLIAIIETLAELIGAENPSHYVLSWPYTKDDISHNQYLRLRIGPTFNDFVELVQIIHSKRGGKEIDRDKVRLSLSLTLDSCIDQGCMVPTFAIYDGVTYRVYRRGETPPREEVCNRILFAWANYGKSLSVTRVAKILATLGLSEEFSEIIQPDAATRGYVGMLPTTSLDTDSAEISHFLRNTGRITTVTDNT